MAAAAPGDHDAPLLGQLHVGCAGYSYPHWRHGVFYPKGLKQEGELRYYAQVFATCEVNTSFYGTPTAETCAQWQQQVKGNGHFTFTLKMRSTVTHGDTPVGPAGGGGSPGRVGEGAKRRLDPLSTEALEAELPLFLERCEQLRTGKDGAFPPSLGVVLFQFPPSFEKSLEALERLARHLPGGDEAPAIAASAAPRGAHRFALEFRHRSWYHPEVYAFMRRQGWGLVQHALIHNVYPDRGIPEIDEVTAPFVYLRLHGKKAEHAWDYTREELQPYCDKIVAWRRRGLDCWIYFLNDADGMAPKNAFELLAIVRAACHEPAPTRPEDQQRQMMASYFNKAKASTPPAAAAGAGAGGDGGGGKGTGEKKTKRGAGEVEAGEATTTTTRTSTTPPPSPKRPRGEEKGEKGSGGGTKGTPAKAAAATTTTPKQSAAAAGTRPLTAFFKKKGEGEGKGKGGWGGACV